MPGTVQFFIACWTQLVLTNQSSRLRRVVGWTGFSCRPEPKEPRYGAGVPSGLFLPSLLDLVAGVGASCLGPRVTMHRNFFDFQCSWLMHGRQVRCGVSCCWSPLEQGLLQVGQFALMDLANPACRHDSIALLLIVIATSTVIGKTVDSSGMSL